MSVWVGDGIAIAYPFDCEREAAYTSKYSSIS